MHNLFRKYDIALFIRKIIHDMRLMRAELNEHRYNLERNVQLRTTHLLKRITLLESCNATLCDRLALAQKELSELKIQLARARPLDNDTHKLRSLKWRDMDSRNHKLLAAAVPREWSRRATNA